MSAASLWILNQHGSLIFEKDFKPSSLTANDRLRLASTLHGLSAIAGQVAPKLPADKNGKGNGDPAPPPQPVRYVGCAPLDVNAGSIPQHISTGCAGPDADMLPSSMLLGGNVIPPNSEVPAIYHIRHVTARADLQTIPLDDDPSAVGGENDTLLTTTGVPSSYSKYYEKHYDSGEQGNGLGGAITVRLSARQQEENLRAYQRADEELIAASRSERSAHRKAVSQRMKNASKGTVSGGGNGQNNGLDSTVGRGSAINNSSPGSSGPDGKDGKEKDGKAPNPDQNPEQTSLRRDKASLRKLLLPTGINRIEAGDFQIFILETLTKLRFILITETAFDSRRIDAIFSRVYSLFSDYVQKDCFLSTEMPFRSELFEQGLHGIAWGA